MQLHVSDTVSLLEPLFVSTDRPSQILAAAQGIFYAEGGLMLTNGGLQAGKSAVLDVVQLDGFDATIAQQAWGLMNPTRSRLVSAWEFQVFRERNVLAEIERLVATWSRRCPADQLPERFEILVVPADSANRNVMLRCHGFSVGGFAGGISATFWPSEHNFARLLPMIARALISGVRRHLAPPQTLADHLALEGLAAVFAAEVSASPTTSIRPWLLPFAEPAGWAQELSRIAALYGLASYEELVTNVYGTRLSGDVELAVAEPLDDDEREYAEDLIRSALDQTDPRLIAAYLYGDAAVVPQGHAGVGMPPFGGFEIAFHAVAATLGEADPLTALNLDSRRLLGPLSNV